MTFDYTYGKVYDYGIRHQFGLMSMLKEQARASEQDIGFFLENKFFQELVLKWRETS